MAYDADGFLRPIHSMDKLVNLTSDGCDGVFMERICENSARMPNENVEICNSGGVEANSQNLTSWPRLDETAVKESHKWQAHVTAVGAHGGRGFWRRLLESGTELIIRQFLVPVHTNRVQN